MLMNPRTVCACQLVTSMISAKVAPLARCIIAITSAFLLARSAVDLRAAFLAGATFFAALAFLAGLRPPLGFPASGCALLLLSISIVSVMVVSPLPAMVCGWTIHRSVPGNKQVNSFRQRIESSGLGSRCDSWRGASGGGGAEATSAAATKSRNVTPPGAIYYKSRFDPNPDLPPRKRRHILEVAIMNYLSRGQAAKPEFWDPRIGIFKFGSPLYPLRAILEERSALTWLLFQFDARPI